ncbi:MAG: type II toxin-antitoxin system HicB family antitoxin [Chloroflexi bacterium]|nr:type II toxin-antitoxin system HicB family antitoxin [Chloroflexota bacterium]
MRHVILIPDLESGGYTVEVPSLPGCISEGDTVEEALANIKEAIIGFEETLIDLGREVPQEITR